MSAGGTQSTWVDLAVAWWEGCHSVGPGCLHCLAQQHLRKQGKAGMVYRGKASEWFKIEHACAGSLILLCPGSDFFIAEAEKWRPEAFEAIKKHQDLIFVALTKRLDEAKEVLARYGTPPNLWLGCSAETQETLDERCTKMFGIEVAGYVLSIQPLLEPVDLSSYISNPLLMKVVVGCEMGKGRRYCNTAWLKDVRRQCRERGVWYYITRYQNKSGKVTHSPTYNGRGSHEPSRPSHNPAHWQVRPGNHFRVLPQYDSIGE